MKKKEVIRSHCKKSPYLRKEIATSKSQARIENVFFILCEKSNERQLPVVSHADN
jgi:hypothetical protein